MVVDAVCRWNNMVNNWPAFFLIVVFFWIPFVIVEAQPYSVNGIITTSDNHTVLPNATVILLIHTDSSIVNFTTTDHDGVFSFSDVKPESYILQVTYVGMQAAYRSFIVYGENVDLGTTYLLPRNKSLDEFVVTADRLPFVVRGDTIEYHAMAFVLEPMEVVEDLLHRMPGIEVDPNGNIYAHGRMVENVLINEKEFFSNDPTIATRNIPAESVHLVQVFNKQSDQAELTGIPDGRDERTINIELNEESQKGIFGQIVGGLGGEDADHARYYSKASLFRFNSNAQYALLGGSENVNQPGFAGMNNSMINPVTRSRFISEGTNGFNESTVGGANSTLTIGRATTLNASYFLMNLHSREDGFSSRLQSSDDSNLSQSSLLNKAHSGSLVHDFHLNANFDFSDGHKMIIRGDISNSRLQSETSGVETFFTLNQKAELVSETSMTDHSNKFSGIGKLAWRKRIFPNGFSLVFEALVSGNNITESRDLLTDTGIMRSGENHQSPKINQYRYLNSNTFRNSQRLELVQPMSDNHTISVYLEHLQSVRNDDQSRTFDLDTYAENDGGNYRKFRQALTYLRPGLKFSLGGTSSLWSVSSELKLQHSWQHSNVAHELGSRRLFTYFLPLLWAHWKAQDKHILHFYYRTRAQEPSVTQVQPFEDRRDPVRISVGNPVLTPEFWHTMFVKYIRMDNDLGLSFHSDAMFILVHNRIVRSWQSNRKNTHSITYVNSSPTWQAGLNIGLRKSNPAVGLDWKMNLDTSINSGIEYFNDTRSERQLLRVRSRVGFDYFIARSLQVEAITSLSWNDLRYTINHALNHRFHNIKVDSGVIWRVNQLWSIDSSMEFQTYDQRIYTIPNRFDFDISITRLFSKNRGQIELSMNDIFNNQNNIEYINSPTYQEAQNLNTLGRYLLLKITYQPRTL
ncbi:MAG: TonB-dependent receptor [Bacteroidetes bacterium]|nr:TonB-dependent receptor [Bacteroidota bacterium]